MLVKFTKKKLFIKFKYEKRAFQIYLKKKLLIKFRERNNILPFFIFSSLSAGTYNVIKIVWHLVAN